MASEEGIYIIRIINGYPQGPSGLIVPNGSIRFQLNTDATIIAAPYGFVFAANPVTFQFNAAGQIQPNSGAFAQIWSNKELNPQNSVGLGTFYLVTFYDQNGALLNTTPLWWQFPETNGSTVDISNMVAIATIGGNIIFYPVNSVGGTGTVTSVAFVGDGVILSPTPSTPVTTAGNISATLLTQSANTFLAGPTTGAAATPTFRAISAADFPAAGSTNQIQYNGGSGAFAASSSFTWTNSSKLLTVAGLASITGIGVTGFNPVLSVTAPANSGNTPIQFIGFSDNSAFFEAVGITSSYTGTLTNSGALHYPLAVRVNALGASGTYGSIGGIRIDIEANSPQGGTVTNLWGIDAHINSGTGNAQVNYTTYSSTFDGTTDATSGYHFRAQVTAAGGATNLWGFYSDNTPNFFGGNTQTNGLALGLRTVVANYQPTVNDCVILANGTLTVTLPTSQPGGGLFVNSYPAVFPVGMLYRVKNISTGSVTVVAQTGNIDGAANYILGSNSSADFHWDGTNYWVL